MFVVCSRCFSVQAEGADRCKVHQFLCNLRDWTVSDALQSAAGFRPQKRCSAISPTARPSPAHGHPESAPLYPVSFGLGLSSWVLRGLARQPVAHGRPRPVHRSSQEFAPEVVACRAYLPCWQYCVELTCLTTVKGRMTSALQDAT